jgi:ElaA protein
MKITETRDIATCRHLRRVVFIDEQGVAESDELDDLDDDAIHLLALINDQPIGSARLLVTDSIGKIGRVCVLKQARGAGVGATLIRAAVDHFRQTPGITKAKLGAQIHALGFYENLGFQATGPIYDDAGIDHCDMVLNL